MGWVEEGLFNLTKVGPPKPHIPVELLALRAREAALRAGRGRQAGESVQLEVSGHLRGPKA